MTHAVKFIAVLLFVSIFSLSGVAAANPDQSGVEQQLLMMKKQMEQMQKKMQELQSQLETTQQSAVSAQQQATQTAQQVDQKVAEVSGKFKTLDDLAKKFSHLKINGYVRSRWWEGDHEEHSFDVTEIAFHLRYDVSENISGEFHLWFHPSGNATGRTEFSNYSNWAGPTTFFESAFAEFRNLNIGPVEGKLIVGKTRNMAYGIVPGGTYDGRVSSDYSLFHVENNISRITGIQYLTKWQQWRWNFAVFNGYGINGDGGRFGARPAGIRQLGVGQLNLDDNHNKAFSSRLGYVFAKQAFIDKLEIGASYFTQKLSDNDLSNFNSIMGRNAGMQGNFFGNPSRARSDRRGGMDLAWDYGPYAVKAEYLRGSVSDVTSDWWYAMVGYKLKPLRMDFWLRYSEANYDQKTIRDIRGSGAWDKKQWTPLIVYHLHPMVDLFFEYYLNDVDKPRNSGNIKDNNYGFVELIVKY
ncbi:MAG: hypothetical protein JW832_16990 [Deltaproteobacteria bacterium]|nr:hypothetical protein [Deltaproteobacteria bacterium]